MGTKRESPESKIISYFSEESDEKVNLLFGIIKGIVARRAPKKAKAAPAGKKAAQTLATAKQGGITLGSPEPEVEERSNGPAVSYAIPPILKVEV